MDVFKGNDYPENFINNYFKSFLENKHRIQEKVIIMSKSFLTLDHYHCKLEPSLENLSKVILIVANFRLSLRVKTN